MKYGWHQVHAVASTAGLPHIMSQSLHTAGEMSPRHVLTYSGGGIAMSYLFGALSWTPKHTWFKFCISVEVVFLCGCVWFPFFFSLLFWYVCCLVWLVGFFNARDSISVNKIVKYLIAWHFKKWNEFLCILCVNMFSKGFSLVHLHYILCILFAFQGNSSVPAGLLLKGCHYLEWII